VIHEERVSRWLQDNIDGLVGPFSFDMIAGGRSNITYRVTDGKGTQVVLRRPPTGHVLATAHDMAREHRIISAVGRTDVPVPRTLGLCEDTSVNDAPFYVMSFVDGVVLDGRSKGELLPQHLRRQASEHLVDVLVALHSVDVDAVGLGDLAKRGNYVERQVKRWSTQWANSKTRELPEIEEVERLLKANIPEQRDLVIAHGDYRFGNCLTDVNNGRIAAVLDWELCTLGDPLADIGYLGAGASPRFWIGSCAHWATLWPTSVISVCIGATPTKCSVVRTIRRGFPVFPRIERWSTCTPPGRDVMCRTSGTTARSRRGALR